MALVVSGLLNKQVAAELEISDITVKAHRGRVMQKMQVRSLADLVRAAEQLGPECTAISSGSAHVTARRMTRSPSSRVSRETGASTHNEISPY